MNKIKKEELLARLAKGPVFLYGGPTTGKSTMISKLNIPSLDTDMLIESIFGAKVGASDWAEAWDLWKEDKPEHSEARAETLAAIKWLLDSIRAKKHPLLVVSNLWDMGPWDYAFWREQEDRVRIFEERAKAKNRPATPSHLERVANWKAPPIPGLVTLSEGEFI